MLPNPASKILTVGDMHVKKDNIAESDRLIAWLEEIVIVQEIDKVVFLGDQYNDMGVVSAEVLSFWDQAFDTLAKHCKIYALVGNHDVAGDGVTSPMYVHRNVTCIGQEPLHIGDSPSGSIWGVGFIRKEADFLAALDKIPHNPRCEKKAAVLMCHQEFQGSQYENGFYAPHGFAIEPVAAKADLILCGHIHKRQAVGPVLFTGTPRQLTRSDAGETKGVDVFNGATGAWTFIPTPQSVCESFQVIKVFNESDLEAAIDKKSWSRVFVELHGAPEFIKKATKALPEHFSVRAVVSNTLAQAAIKESDGLPKAFENFTLQYADKVKNSSEISQLVPSAIAEIYSRCQSLKG